MEKHTNIQELEELYLDLIQPRKLITHFTNDMEFVEWLQLGTTDELQWCLMFNRLKKLRWRFYIRLSNV